MRAFHSSSATASEYPAQQKERSFPVFRVQVIEHFHQSFATCPQHVLIEKVQLGHTLTEEVTQHDASFMVPVPILPDFVQALYRGIDNVAGILSGGEKLHRRTVTVINRKVSFLKKLFSYAVDKSLMLDNPATRKKMRRTEEKKRQRLSLEHFMAIRRAAAPWLRTAMDLALQTTHARLEVSRIRYSIREPKNGVCGCVCLEQPKEGIYGTLYIHRQKVQRKEASHVAIPIGDVLKRIIDESRDNVASPFVVYRIPERQVKRSKEVSHPTQVAPDYLSRSFSSLRDELGLCDHLTMDERPTFHEIRALAAHLFNSQGIDPQGRMARSDAKSTRIYTQNHIDWIVVPHGEIKYNA